MLCSVERPTLIQSPTRPVNASNMLPEDLQGSRATAALAGMCSSSAISARHESHQYTPGKGAAISKQSAMLLCKRPYRPIVVSSSPLEILKAEGFLAASRHVLLKAVQHLWVLPGLRALVGLDLAQCLLQRLETIVPSRKVFQCAAFSASVASQA